MHSVLRERSLTLKLCMGVPLPLPVVTDHGCVFWSSDGCLLPRAKRPLGCLLLIPNEESVLEGEPRCALPKEVSYLNCFERWRSYYQVSGMWEEVLILARELLLY